MTGWFCLFSPMSFDFEVDFQYVPLLSQIDGFDNSFPACYCKNKCWMHMDIRKTKAQNRCPFKPPFITNLMNWVWTMSGITLRYATPDGIEAPVLLWRKGKRHGLGNRGQDNPCSPCPCKNSGQSLIEYVDFIPWWHVMSKTCDLVFTL